MFSSWLLLYKMYGSLFIALQLLCYAPKEVVKIYCPIVYIKNSSYMIIARILIDI